MPEANAPLWLAASFHTDTLNCWFHLPGSDCLRWSFSITVSHLRLESPIFSSQKPCTCLTSAITSRTLASQRCSLWPWGTFGAGAIWISHRRPRNSKVCLKCPVLPAVSFKFTAVTSLAVKYSFDYSVIWILPVMAECLSWPREGLPVFYFFLLNQRGKLLTTSGCKSAVGLHVQKCKRKH